MPAIVANVVTAALVVVAFAMTAIAFRAWTHSRSRKVLLLAAGFGLFLVEGIMLAIGLFTVRPWEQLLVPSIVLDLGILGTFYMAVMA